MTACMFNSRFNSLDVFITDVSVVFPLWVTSQVIIELVKKYAGNKLCVLGHGQLIGQLRYLTTHLKNLPQA